MDIELKLRELLLPVFGLESIDEILPDASLIKDIGADSLDFVEIIHLLDKNFGVSLTANSLMAGGADVKGEELFEDGKLTLAGADILKQKYFEKSENFKVGMTKIELFALLTVKDLAEIVKSKRKEKC